MNCIVRLPSFLQITRIAIGAFPYNAFVGVGQKTVDAILREKISESNAPLSLAIKSKSLFAETAHFRMFVRDFDEVEFIQIRARVARAGLKM